MGPVDMLPAWGEWDDKQRIGVEEQLKHLLAFDQHAFSIYIYLFL